MADGQTRVKSYGQDEHKSKRTSQSSENLSFAECVHWEKETDEPKTNRCSAEAKVIPSGSIFIVLSQKETKKT